MMSHRSRNADRAEVRQWSAWTFPEFARSILGKPTRYLYERLDSVQQVIHLPSGDLPFHYDPFHHGSRVIESEDWRRLEQQDHRPGRTKSGES